MKTYAALPPGCPTHTIWGKPQHVTVIADGIWWISTASHGGYKLDHERNAWIPALFRSEGGWYEEDCDWAIPHYFLNLEPLDKLEEALETLRNWHWRAYEKHFHETIPPGQSFLKDEHLFARAHVNDWVVISASNIGNGMVGCHATLGGKRHAGVEQRRFLVPSDEYAGRGKHGFVIDPARHETWQS